MPSTCVTVHYAQSLDGRIATRSGDARWISGSQTLELAHELRAAHAAVLVGVGTVLADDPYLTVRLVPGPSPRRIVVDSGLRLPLDSNVLDQSAPTIVATTSRAPIERIQAIRERGAEVCVVPADWTGRVDLAQLFQQLAANGVTRILIEGGRSVVTTALRNDLVDRLIVCIAPKLIGMGIDAVGDLGVRRLVEAATFQDVTYEQRGEDLIFSGWLKRPQPVARMSIGAAG